MSPGQMLPGQMSSWQLGYVKDGPRNLSLNVGQNRFSNSWDIADIEFMVVVGGGGGGVKSFSCKTQTYVRLGWVEVGLGFWQQTTSTWCCPKLFPSSRKWRLTCCCECSGMVRRMVKQPAYAKDLTGPEGGGGAVSRSWPMSFSYVLITAHVLNNKWILTSTP